MNSLTLDLYLRAGGEGQPSEKKVEEQTVGKRGGRERTFDPRTGSPKPKNNGGR